MPPPRRRLVRSGPEEQRRGTTGGPRSALRARPASMIGPSPGGFMQRRTLRLAAVAALLSVTLVVTVAAQKARTDHITSPKEQFGFDIGADYQLPNYTQLTEYWKKLDQQSDRMTLVEIGKTAE